MLFYAVLCKCPTTGDARSYRKLANTIKAYSWKQESGLSSFTPLLLLCTPGSCSSLLEVVSQLSSLEDCSLSTAVRQEGTDVGHSPSLYSELQFKQITEYEFKHCFRGNKTISYFSINIALNIGSFFLREISLVLSIYALQIKCT